MSVRDWKLSGTVEKMFQLRICAWHCAGIDRSSGAFYRCEADGLTRSDKAAAVITVASQFSVCYLLPRLACGMTSIARSLHVRCTSGISTSSFQRRGGLCFRKLGHLDWRQGGALPKRVVLESGVSVIREFPISPIRAANRRDINRLLAYSVHERHLYTGGSDRQPRLARPRRRAHV